VTDDPKDATTDRYMEMHEAALASLLPCPFCKGSMRDCCSGAKEGVLQFVVCPTCGATMGEAGEEPESPIIERWNRRTPEGAAPGGRTPEEEAFLAAHVEWLENFYDRNKADMDGNTANSLLRQLNGLRALQAAKRGVAE
jgi:hypothetical protein